MADILVVDDDQSIATAFQHFLSYEGHTCRLASSADDAIRLIEERRPSLVMMDVRMPGTDGLQALQTIRGRFPDVYVVIMTAYGTSQTSIDAIRAGAFDYLTKPLDLDDLRETIEKVLTAQQSSDATSSGSADGIADAPSMRLVGDTPAMLDVYKMIGRLSTNDVPALVVGERGTGKQLVVATIHDNSSRHDRSFVVLDCVELSEGVIESKLFDADTGTIQLRHVEALPPLLQARLAQALGGERARAAGPAVRARIIASTERDLADEVRAGKFNRALYDVLAVITLRMPPLRERRDDILPLVRYFVQRFNAELNRAIKGVDDQVARMLQAHAWTGNVGELERVVKRACIVTGSDVITVGDIGESLTDSRFPEWPNAEATLIGAARTALHDRLVQSSGAASSAFHDIVDVVETTLVREALTITNGNQVKAAEILGVNRATLRKKMPDE